MRQSFFNNERLPDINILTNSTRNEDSFKNLKNTKIAKQVIRQVLNDWSNYFKSLREYNKNPNKFVKKPKPPGYKKKLSQVIFYNETIKNGRSNYFVDKIIPTNNCFEIKSKRHYKQVSITPKHFGFMIDVQYLLDKEIENSSEISNHNKNNKKLKFCNIDLGVNNLCTITSDQFSPVLINGRICKSFNQYYNKNKNQKEYKHGKDQEINPKEKKYSRKRYWRFENYFHHTSKYIIDLCMKHNIKRIIIGKNDGWKKDIKMDKKHRQNFFYIPFNNLLKKIQYKALLSGIEVIFTEESYTSKASFLDRDIIPVYDKKDTENYQFSGQRIKRGLYRSSKGILINADVNGSGNIGRKIMPDSTFGAEWDRSLAARPVIVNPLREKVC